MNMFGRMMATFLLCAVTLVSGNIFAQKIEGQELGGGSVDFTETYRIGLDLDQDSGSGCNFVAATGQTVPGVEMIMTIVVDSNGASPTVSHVSYERCGDGPGNLPSGWLVGLDNGTDGADVIEAQIPLGVLGRTSAIDLIFDAASLAGGADQLPDAGANTVTYTLPYEIPTLGFWALAMMVTLLLLASLWVMRRNRRASLFLMVLASFSLLAITMMPFTSDGEVDDWSGLDPLATDGVGDAGNDAVDLVAVFVANDDDNLYFRIDVADSENDAPDAVDDTATTDEEVPVVINVVANDSDPDTGDILSVSAVGSASLGTVVNNGDGTVTYTPGAGNKGADSFTYTITDVRGLTDSASVSITVNGTNDPPVAVDDSASTSEETPVVISVLANDSDPDTGDTLSVSSVTQGALGSVVINGDNTVTYTPGLNNKGMDSFTYTVSDGSATDTATVTVTISAENDPPVAQNDSYSVDEGGSLAPNAASGVLANDSDPDTGASLTAVLQTTTSNGVLALAADGSFTYTHDGGETTSDSFTYVANDGTLNSAVATVNLTVNPINDAPVSMDDTATVDEDSFVDIDVLANDSDVDPGDVLTVILVDDGSDGATAIRPNKTIRYTPDVDYNGNDTFTYTIRDLAGVETSSTVSVTINPANDAPSAQSDSAVTLEDTAVDIYVLGNDTDIDGDGLTVQSVGASADGMVANLGDRVSFTPNGGFTGSTSFTYDAFDGTVATSATVTVNVQVDMGDPILGDDNGTTGQGEPIVLDVLANDLDNGLGPLLILEVSQPANGAAFILAAGDPLGRPDRQTVGYVSSGNFSGVESFTYKVVDTNGNTFTATVEITVTPSKRSPTAQADVYALEVNTSITFDPRVNDFDPDGQSLDLEDATHGIHGTVVLNPDNTITYTPDLDYIGSDTLSYSVLDPDGLGDSALVSLSIVAVGNLPYVFDDDVIAVEDTPVDIDVIANDPGMLPIDSITQPGNGVATVNMDGTVNYAPNANFNGPDSFTYTVNPVEEGGPTTTATVNLDVRSQKDAPVANFINVITSEDTPIDIDVLASTDDPDGPGPPLLIVVTPSIHGTTSINPDDTVHYVPDPGYAGEDLFSYTVVGASSFARSGLVRVDVGGVNDAPSFTEGADQTVDEDAGAQSVNAWATNLDDGDGGGQILTFNVTNNTNAALFAVVPAIDGTTGDLTYTPADDANGSADITVELMDNGGTADGGDDTSDPVTFTITVNSVNDVPVFTVGADQSIPEGAPAQSIAAWATGISAGPANESGQMLTFNVTNNTNAALFDIEPAVAEDGTLTYTPAADENGSATITLELMDDGGTANGGVDTSATQTFTITIGGVNDEPSFDVGVDQTVLEDAGAQSVNNWATNISAGPPDENGQTLTFNITNNTNAALFAAGPAVSSDGTLTYTPADDANGSATITLELMDNGGTANGGDDTSPSASFTINVTSVNDEPTFTAGADQTVLEDAGAQSVNNWATSIDAGAANESGQTLSFSVTNNTNAGLFSVAPAIATDGTLTYTPADDANGSADITIELADDGGTADGGDDTSAAATFTINVTAVNDEPSFDVGADVNYVGPATAQTEAGWATNLSAGPADESGQTLSFNITNNTNAGIFAAGPAVDGTTGDLTYTPVNGASGSATITIELQDNGGTANGGDDTSASTTFTIMLTSVNNEPSFTVGADQSVLEDAGAQSVNGWATNIDDGDGDTQNLTFNVTGNTNMALFAAGPAVDATTGNLTYTPADDANGSATITLELMDDGGTANGGDDTSPSASFTITVTAVNDAPSFTVGADESVAEDSGAQTANGWATSISAGPADESGQSVSFNISNNNNALFSAQPAVDNSGNLTYTPANNASGSATVTISISDDGGTANGGVDTSADQTFTITVNAVNDPPMAVADSSYETLPHVSLAVDRASPAHGHIVSTFGDVLANDSDSDSASIAVTTIVGSGDTTEPFTGATDQGGTVVMYADGSFYYHPPANFSNAADTFQYTIEDTEGEAVSATVTITVANVAPIWFIDDTAAGGGDGTAFTPFNTVADFVTNAMDAAGDTIFIHTGNTGVTALDSALTLLDNQVLHGQGIALTATHPEDASTATIVAASTHPEWTNSVGDIITTGAGNTIQGLTLLATNGSGVYATGAGLTLDEMMIQPDDAHSGVFLDGASGTVSLSNTDFAGGASHTGSGLKIDNSDATVNVSDTTFTDHGIALDIETSSGAVTLTDCTLTLTTNGFDNQAIDVTSPLAGASLNLAGSTSITTAELGSTVRGVVFEAIYIDGGGNDFDFDLATTASLNLDASNDSYAIRIENLGAGSSHTYQGPVVISGAGSVGVDITSSSGIIDFDDLEISGVGGDSIDVQGGDATITVTLDNTNGLVNTGDRSLDVRNMTGGSFNVDGGTIDDNASGIRFDSNAFGAGSGVASTLDIDHTSGTGIEITNNTGSGISLTGTVTVNAADLMGVNISSNDDITLNDVTIAITNTAGGGQALNIDNTGLTATFTSITCNNGAGKGVNLDTNTGSTIFGALDITTANGIGFDATSAGSIRINNGGGGTATVTSTNALGVDIDNTSLNTTGGTPTFTSVTVSGTGGGVNLDSNSGTLEFDDLDINVSGGTGFAAVNGGTVNVDSGDANSASVVAAGQKALDLDGITADINLTTANSTGGGATHGIDINNVAGSVTIDNSSLSNTTAGVEITSASGTFTFDALAITVSAGSGMILTSSGTVNVDSDNSAATSISATGGPAVDIHNTTLGINFDSMSSTNSGTFGVDMTTIPTGSSFEGGTTTIDNATSFGVNIDTTAGTASIGFGNTSITNRNATGVMITSHAGTGGVTFGDVDIANPNNAGGNAVHVTSSSGGVQLDSLDASDTNQTVARADGGGDGIPDNNTDDGHAIALISHTGGFTITGTGTQGNGGTMQNLDGDGIRLDGSSGLNLTSVTINNIGLANLNPNTVDDAGIYGVNITGSHLIQESTISRFQTGAGGNDRGIRILQNGTSLTEFRVNDTTFFNDAAIAGDDGILVTGLGTVNGSLVVESDFPVGHGSNRSEFYQLSGIGVQVNLNGSGTFTTDISNTTLRDSVAGGGFGGIELAAIGTVVMDNTITDCTLTDLYDLGVNNGGMIVLFAGESADFSGTVDGCTLDGSLGRGGIRAVTGELVTDTVQDYDITINNCTIDDTDREAITVFLRGESVLNSTGNTSDIIITNNDIGQTTAVPVSGREGIEIRAYGSTAAKTMNLLIQNNNINSFANSTSDETVDIDAEDFSAINLTFLGNTLTLDGSSTSNPNSLEINTEDAGTSICLDLNGDNVGANSNSADDGIVLTETAGTFTIEDLGANAPKTFLEARNAATVTVSGTLTDSGGDCPSP